MQYAAHIFMGYINYSKKLEEKNTFSFFLSNAVRICFGLHHSIDKSYYHRMTSSTNNFIY